MPPAITREFPTNHLIRCRVWFPKKEKGARGHTSIQIDGPVPPPVAHAFTAIAMYADELTERELGELRELTARLKKRAGAT